MTFSPPMLKTSEYFLDIMFSLLIYYRNLEWTPAFKYPVRFKPKSCILLQHEQMKINLCLYYYYYSYTHTHNLIFIILLYSNSSLTFDGSHLLFAKSNALPSTGNNKWKERLKKAAIVYLCRSWIGYLIHFIMKASINSVSLPVYKEVYSLAR